MTRIQHPLKLIIPAPVRSLIVTIENKVPGIQVKSLPGSSVVQLLGTAKEDGTIVWAFGNNQTVEIHVGKSSTAASIVDELRKKVAPNELVAVKNKDVFNVRVLAPLTST